MIKEIENHREITSGWALLRKRRRCAAVINKTLNESHKHVSQRHARSWSTYDVFKRDSLRD